MSRGWLGAAPEEWAYEPGGSSTPRRRSVKVHETSSDSYVPIANSGTGQTVTDPSFDTEPMTRARRCGVAQVCCTGRSGTTRHPPTASTSGVLGTRRHSTTTADTRSRDFPSCIREFDSPHPLRTQPPPWRGFRRSRSRHHLRGHTRRTPSPSRGGVEGVFEKLRVSKRGANVGALTTSTTPARHQPGPNTSALDNERPPSRHCPNRVPRTGDVTSHSVTYRR